MRTYTTAVVLSYIPDFTWEISMASMAGAEWLSDVQLRIRCFSLCVQLQIAVPCPAGPNLDHRTVHAPGVYCVEMWDHRPHKSSAAALLSTTATSLLWPSARHMHWP